MNVTITLELSQADVMRLRQNSLERVLNNASRVGAAVESKATGSLADYASTLWQDADELNPLATRLWNAAREATWKESN